MATRLVIHYFGLHYGHLGTIAYVGRTTLERMLKVDSGVSSSKSAACFSFVCVLSFLSLVEKQTLCT